MKSGQSQHRLWLSVFSAAIFRPAGYKAAGFEAAANPSAFSNFADSSCYAVQFSQHFFFFYGAKRAIYEEQPLFGGMVAEDNQKVNQYRRFQNNVAIFCF